MEYIIGGIVGVAALLIWNKRQRHKRFMDHLNSTDAERSREPSKTDGPVRMHTPRGVEILEKKKNP